MGAGWVGDGSGVAGISETLPPSRFLSTHAHLTGARAASPGHTWVMALSKLFNRRGDQKALDPREPPGRQCRACVCECEREKESEGRTSECAPRVEQEVGMGLLPEADGGGSKGGRRLHRKKAEEVRFLLPLHTHTRLFSPRPHCSCCSRRGQTGCRHISVSPGCA